MRLSSSEYLTLDRADLERFRYSGEPRVVVDGQNRPVLNRLREKALRRLEELSWWNVSEHFPEKPDENAQFRVAMSWWFGFTVTSSMLMAPVIASVASIYYADADPGLQPSVATAVAVISLMLLLLVMQRLAPALWGKWEQPGVIARRALVLLLPSSVIASNWWLAYPMESVRMMGFIFPLVYMLLLIILLLQFAYLYAVYTSRSEAREFLENATPQDTIRAYYGLLQPAANGDRRRRLGMAVQYLEPFRRSTYLAGGEHGDGRWVWPSSDRPQSLVSLENEVDRSSHALYQGDRLLDLQLRGAVFLRPASDTTGREVLACCAVESRATQGILATSIRGPGRGSEKISVRPYVFHRLLRCDDGWYLADSLASTLPAKEVESLRIAGLLP